MNPLLQFILINTAGLLIPALFSFVMTESESTKGKIWDAIYTGLLGLMIVSVAQFQWQNFEVKELLERLRNPGELTVLETQIKKHEDGGFRNELSKLYVDLGDIAKDAIRGEIYYEGEERSTAAWSAMFSAAQTSLDATNYISAKFWRSNNFDQLQRNLHRSAVKRGLNVRRVFIYDKGEDNSMLVDLGDEQSKLGVNVRYIEREALETSRYFLKEKSNLKGSIDFVIYDVNAALLVSHNGERKISGSILTNQREVVDSSQALFTQIWADALNAPM